MNATAARVISSKTDAAGNLSRMAASGAKRPALDIGVIDLSQPARKRMKMNDNAASNAHLDALSALKQNTREEMSKLAFTKPTHVYNPLQYAWNCHYKYLKLVTIPTNPLNEKLNCEGKVLLLGMNPGPHGMTQSGIPFGDVNIVKKWMNINELIKEPIKQNPKRKVIGLNYHRKEMSGTRLYSWAKLQFGGNYPFKFFSRFVVFNYCPLCFMDNAKNMTPQQLNKKNKIKLFELCDDQLIKTINIMKPKYVVAIGNFAEQCIIKVFNKMKKLKQGMNQKNDLYIDFKIGKVMHPSGRNPKSHKWHIYAPKQLDNVGIEL